VRTEEAKKKGDSGAISLLNRIELARDVVQTICTGVLCLFGVVIRVYFCVCACVHVAI